MELSGGDAGAPTLQAEDGHLRNLAASLGLAYLLPLGRGPGARVFKARGIGGMAVAVKSLSLGNPESSEVRARKERRAQRERDLAHWAAKHELGPPILRHAVLPLAACLVMPCAETDLQLFWHRRARAAPLAVTRRLWRDAFVLATAGPLCEKLWLGADLKPANLLLYRDSSDWRVRLNDFDARFWRRAADSAASARLANSVVLLSNSLFLLPLPALVPHLPDTAVALLRRLLREDPALLTMLHEILPWLRRGLLHYSRAPDLAAHLALLRERAALHGYAEG